MKKLILILVASILSACASKIINKSAENEPNGLELKITRVEVGGDALDFEYQVKNNYNFPIVVKENAFMVSSDNVMATRIIHGNPRMELEPGQIVTGEASYDFDNGHAKQFKIVVKSIFTGVDEKAVMTQSSGNVVGSAFGTTEYNGGGRSSSSTVLVGSGSSQSLTRATTVLGEGQRLKALEISF